MIDEDNFEANNESLDISYFKDFISSEINKFMSKSIGKWLDQHDQNKKKTEFSTSGFLYYV